MPEKKKIPFTLNFTPRQIEALYDRLLEQDPEAARRITGKKLLKLLKEIHVNIPDAPEEEIEKDVEETIRAIRGQA